MMAGYSIRLRLTLWYSAVLSASLLVFGFVLWFGLEQRLIQAVDQRLAWQIESLRTVLEIETPLIDKSQLKDELSEYAQEVVNGEWIVLYDSLGQQLLPRHGPPLIPAKPGQNMAFVNGRQLRIRSGQFGNAGRFYTAVVASPLDEVTDVLETLRGLLMFLIPAVLAACCAGGYWISGRALAPVDAITAVAKTISVQNLSQRLVVPATGDALQRMSETWNEVLGRLEAAVTRIQRFTADASHELRTPLALIRATAELALRRERPAEEYRKALGDIVLESERMTHLTEGLLTLARSDSGTLPLPLERTELSALVSGVVREWQPLAEQRGLQLEQVIPAAMVEAEINPNGIRRVLFILLDNALKHTPRGGAVTVSLAPESAGWLLSVADTGEGIPAEALPHIFERFFTADPARSGNKGVGLGLSIAQVIAVAHHTEIQVQSQPGIGSRFTLSFR